MKSLRVLERLPIPVEFAATMKYALLAKSNGEGAQAHPDLFVGA